MKNIIYLILFIFVYFYNGYGASISGHIDNQTEYNNIYIKVRAITGDLTNPIFIPGVVNSDLNFIIDNLSVGIYIVEAFVDQDNNDEPDPDTPIHCYISNEDTLCTQITILAENDQIANINILFDEGGPVLPSGNSKIFGKVINNTNYSNELIKVQGILKKDTIYEFFVTGLDSNNEYVLDSLPSGTYRVEAFIDENNNGKLDSGEIVNCFQAEGDTGCTDVLLGENEERGGIDIELKEKQLVGNSIIEGKVINLSPYEGDIYVMANLDPDGVNTVFIVRLSQDSTYRFDNLPSGEYVISAVIDTNYNGRPDSLDYIKCYKEENDFNDCTHLFVDDGAHLKNIDIVFENVETPGQSIIRGHVDNKTKFNEFSIIVRAIRIDENDIREVEALDNGDFEIVNLLPGIYLVEAFIDLNGNGLWDTLEIHDCYRVEGDTVCKEIILDSDAVYDSVIIVLKEEEIENNSSISGKVISNKEGVGPIVVVCESDKYYKNFVLSSPGSFTFQNLPAGLYKLYAFEDLNRDTSFTEGEVWNCYRSGDNIECDSIFVGVNDEVKNKNIELFFPYLRIRGRIIDSVEKSGNIYVLLNEDSLIHSNTVIRIPVNEENIFEMQVMVKGTFFLFAHKDIDNNLSVDDVDYFGIYDLDGDGESDPIVINGFMDDIDDIEINLSKKVGESMQKKAFIRGKILFPEGAPINFMGVKAVNKKGDVFQTIVDSQTFDYNLLVLPGSYYVMTEETEDYFSTFYKSTTNMDEATLVSVANNDTADAIDIEVKQKIRQTGVLSGIVIDSVSNNPLSEVLLRLYNDSLSYNVTTDINGNYIFNKILAADYYLDLQKDGFKPVVNREIHIIPDSTIIYNVSMVPMNIDTIPPEIIPVHPIEKDTNVFPNTNIVIDLFDYQSGINRNSIFLAINNVSANYEINDLSEDNIRIIYVSPQAFFHGDTVHVKVSAYDNNSNFAEKQYYFVIKKDRLPPLFITYPSVKQLSTTTATINFSTNELSQAEIIYYPENTTDTMNFITNYFSTKFDIVLTNLNSNTKYNYYVKIIDKSLNGPVFSEVDTFKTLAEKDVVPPSFLNGPFVTSLSSYNALISFQADEPVSAKIYYDTSLTNFTHILKDTLIDKHHTIMLSNLMPDTKYYYKIEIFDQDSNFNVSGILSFKTFEESDINPPVFTQGPSIIDITYNSALLFGTTDEMSQVTIVINAPDGNSFSITDNFDMEHRIMLSNLLSSSIYTYSLFAIDMQGNKTNNFQGSFRTTDAPDTIPPQIFNVREISPTENSITIMCDNNEPACIKIFYGLDTTQMLIMDDPVFDYSHSVMIHQLAADTLYYYFIKASDLSSNITKSELFTFRTNSIVDTTPPLIVAGPGIVSYSDKAIFNFTTDEPAITVVYYWKESSPDYVMTASETDFYEIHSIILTGLEPSQTYIVRAEINDRTGNQTIWPEESPTSKLNKRQKNSFVASFMSNNILQTQNNSFNTNSNADTSAPEIIEGPTAYERTDNFISIYWKTDEPSMGQVYYGTLGSFVYYQTESQYVTEHYMTIYNLEENTEYNFIIFNTDVNGNGPIQYTDTLIYKTIITEDNTPPQLVEDIAIKDISSDRAVIITKTDEPSLLRVKLFGDNSELIKDYATSLRKKEHKVFLTNLEAAKNYISKNDLCDARGNCNLDIEKEFMTEEEPDINPPVFIDTSFAIGKDYFKFNILFDEFSTILLEYKELGELDFVSISNLDPADKHSIMVTKLNPNTMYKIKVYFQDTYGNVDSIKDIMVATLAEPDTIAPARPSQVYYSLFENDNKINIYWNSVEEEDLKGYNIYFRKDSLEEFFKIGSNVLDTFFIDEGDNFDGFEYGITSVDFEGNESQIQLVHVSLTDLDENNKISLKKFIVENNYPNPFNPITVIKYYVPYIAEVDIKIFNILGQKVFSSKKKQKAGWHKLIWNASPYSSGIYFCKFKIGKEEVIKKMVLLK